MSDDTTTWLKKNPTINPMRRSFKTSMRFHVPNHDMDASIISNPDKAKNPEVFIPRMLQRTNVQMRMSRAHHFKVPELSMSKPVKKKESVIDTGLKTKKSPAVKKSYLPVRRAPEKETKKINLPKVSLIPGDSGRRTLARREIIQKMMELSEIKKNQEEASSQSKIISSDNSVLRSILKKKRASLRRASQISGSKPKAKKVLFNGFATEDAEKENDANLETRLEQQSNDFAVLDEPTAFFNFPNSQRMEASPRVAPEDSSSACESETNHLESNSAANILKLWNSCRENVNNLHTMRNSLENSYELLFRQAQTFKAQYASYKKDSEEIYGQLSKLSEELEENMKKTLEGSNFGAAETSKPKRRSAGKKLLDKVEKIRLSDKSKAIKRNSGKKTSTALKKGLLKDMEDSFSLAYMKSSMDE